MGHLNINTFPIDLGASFWLTVAAVLNFGQGLHSQVKFLMVLLFHFFFLIRLFC